MDFRTSKNVIDFIFKNDMSDLIQIGFMGGEPLIKYDVLYYIVNYIKEYYPTRLVRYYITTNGVLLTEKIVRFLSLNNFDTPYSYLSKNEADIFQTILHHALYSNNYTQK